MAILKCLPGVKVEILVDGKALKEYKDSDLAEEPNTINRYIEAKSGQRFAVFFQMLPSFRFKGDVHDRRVHIDGQEVWGQPGLRKNRTQGSWMSEGPNGDPGGPAFHYCFSAVETVHDGHQKDGELSKFKDLASIVIQCHYSNLKKSKARKGEMLHPDADGPGKISEKALKGEAISHNVRHYTTAMTKTHRCRTLTGSSHVTAGGLQPEFMVSAYEPLSEGLDPDAVFVFCYRSFDALKSMLTIPRTPSPPPLEDRDSSSLSQDEVKQLRKQLVEFKKRQAAETKVKLEPGDVIHVHARPHVPALAILARLGIDDSGRVREGSAANLPPAEKVVIQLD